MTFLESFFRTPSFRKTCGEDTRGFRMILFCLFNLKASPCQWSTAMHLRTDQTTIIITTRTTCGLGDTVVGSVHVHWLHFTDVHYHHINGDILTWNECVYGMNACLWCISLGCTRCDSSNRTSGHIWSASTAALFKTIVEFTVVVLDLDPSYPARLDYFMVPNEAALHLDQLLEVILRNWEKKSTGGHEQRAWWAKQNWFPCRHSPLVSWCHWHDWPLPSLLQGHLSKNKQSHYSMEAIKVGEIYWGTKQRPPLYLVCPCNRPSFPRGFSDSL